MEDRLRGMMFSLTMGDAMVTRGLYLQEYVDMSSSLNIALLLAEELRNASYKPDIVTKVYIDAAAKGMTPSDLNNALDPEGFEARWGISYKDIFEEYPSSDTVYKTGVYHRAVILATTKDLDALIYDVWLTNPHVDTFTDAYVLGSVLRLLLHGWSPSKIVDTVKFEGSYQRLMKKILITDDDTIIISALEASRDVSAIASSIYGARHGYRKLMSMGVWYYNNKQLDPGLLESWVVDSAMQRMNE